MLRVHGLRSSARASPLMIGQVVMDYVLLGDNRLRG
jgi:hypothetical protein